MKRVDGFLSRKAQAAWPKALVYCETDEDTSSELWTMERPEILEPLGLGSSYGAANQAVTVLVRAEKGDEVYTKCVNALRRCVFAMDLYMDGQEDTNEIVGALAEAKRILERIEPKKAAPTADSMKEKK